MFINKLNFVIFDLDGVLFDGKDIHFNALNRALSEIDPSLEISIEDHLNKYDGLKTTQKLEILTREKGLDKIFYNRIWNLKQEFTFKEVQNLTKNNNIFDLLLWLKSNGIKIGCCSNSIKKTVEAVLSNLDIIDLFDIILSNEDVKNSKPHQEIYCKAMAIMGEVPEKTLIIEDSPHGLMSAHRSGAFVHRVSGSKDLNIKNIEKAINNINNNNKIKWTNNKMNVLIPMAGAGSRFVKAGYDKPKPLIEIKGKPMIQVVVENLSLNANYTFVVQKSHNKMYNLSSILEIIRPNCNVVEVDGITEGAACTSLLAKEFINNDEPLFFANSDQFVEWDPVNFFYKMQESNCDGGIVTFEASHPKWSYAKVNEDNVVVEVAEKNPISNNATVGFYYWKRGSDFVKYAEQMIEKDIRVNNEFYVCPVFNEAIQDGKKILNYKIEKMWGLGTPEDLEFYMENFK